MTTFNISEISAVYANVQTLATDGNVQTTVSTDAKAAFSQHADEFNYRAALELAKAGDVSAAEAIRVHLADRYGKVELRHKTARVENARNKQFDAKEAARLNWEQDRLGKMLDALNDTSAQGVVYEEGIITMLRKGEEVDAEYWAAFEDHNVDKACHTSGQYSTYDLIRILNKGGAGTILNVVGNATVVATLAGFAFNITRVNATGAIATESIVVNGRRAHEILLSGKHRQNAPYSKLGVLKSRGVPNLDGKTSVVLLSAITGDEKDKDTKIRLFCDDITDKLVVRVHLYRLNPLKNDKYQDENVQLAKYFGNNGFIIRGLWDREFFMLNYTVECNATNPDKLANMRQPKGYLDPAKLDEATLSDINLYIPDQIKRLEANAAKSADTSIATSRQQSAPIAKSSAKGKSKKIANPDADEVEY